jgi:hypothetical protein
MPSGWGTGCSRSRAGTAEASGRATPAGLALVNTLAWSARKIDRRATDAVVWSGLWRGGTLLASSFPYSGRGTLGSGLTGYSLAGTRKFHRYGDEPVAGVQPLGSKVLVMTPRRATLIDPRTGRELRSYRRLFGGTPVVGDRSFPPTADG